ncbi:MAG: DUF3568 family protein [Gemmatimonadota bacterium]|nr:MAG: DUF3568 family protein [Gemmatimonadota bacterium]
MDAGYVLRRLPVALFAGLVSSGCVVAAAGAGAGAGIYYTSQGVESVVDASVDATFAAAERAFRHFEIEQTSMKVEEGGAKRELEGKSESADVDVKVKFERQGESTYIEVTARESLVEWDKDFARAIVAKIVELAH